MDDHQESSTSMAPSLDPWTETGSLTLFEAGDLVAGRYRVFRFIARGGAAEVYEVQDQELGQQLALKALRRDPSKTRVIDRFKREINLARQVTHPNVCRIYEFGSHGADVLFLTMELLNGETLLERLERTGRMSPPVALPLVRQMADGLDAAHQAGVIHRDFKSGNVMLVPTLESDPVSPANGLRAVITDFGLARAAVDDPGPHVTAQDSLVGTPTYMAPEQVEGLSITPLADIYAFGVVLYEMLTRHYPFQGESSLATAVMRLKEDPIPPSEAFPYCDEHWESVILRCLERQPEKRFASAAKIVEALEHSQPVRALHTPDSVDVSGVNVGGILSGGLAGSSLAGSGGFLRKLRWVALLVIVVAMGVGLWLRREQPSTPGTDAGSRSSIALLGFHNRSGDPSAQWLSTALAEMLTTEIAAGEDIRVIPGENVAQTRIELGLGEVDSLPRDTVSRIGDILGAGMVVVGSYLATDGEDGQEIRLDLEVRSASSGEVVARLTERGEVLDLVERAGRSLRDGLGLADLSAAEAEAVAATRPVDSESARLYAQGLEELRLYNAKKALELLQAAVTRDPDKAMIHSALSAAFASLSFLDQAKEEALRAVELATDLSRRERLWVEARHHELSGERQKALESYRVLWDYYGDHLEYGLRLAQAQIRTSDGEGALVTLAQARARSTDVGADPRIDLAEAEAFRALGRYEEMQRRSADAAGKAESLGAKLLLARARKMEADAYRELGEHDLALRSYAEARQIYAAANNRGSVAILSISLARIHRYQGDLDGARSLAEQALDVARDLGDPSTVRRSLSLLTLILREQGRLSEALARHEVELEAVREAGEIRSLQISLTSLGVVQQEMGNLDQAQKSFEEALELSYRSGNQRSVAINHNLLGEVLLHQGQVATAKDHFEQALAANEMTKSRRGRAYYLANLGEAHLAAGRLVEARRLHEEALEIRVGLGEKTNMAFSRLSLADLALAEGRPELAEPLAREAVAQFQGEGRTDAEGYSRAWLARSLLELDRSSQAEAEIRRSLELLETSEHQEFRLVAGLSAGIIDDAAGRGDSARERLTRAFDDATKFGFFGLALESDLFLGRLEIQSDPAAGAARLRAVAKEASERGFQRIADQASGEVP